jgi:hypothetical protein
MTDTDLQGTPQGRARGKQREMVSPRNGAVCPTLPPGKSGNPAGSSAKMRLRGALNQALKDGTARQLIEQLLRDATQRKSAALRFKNLELVLRAAGMLRHEDDERVTVEAHVTLLDRRDGSQATPLRADVAMRSGPRALGTGADPS